MIGAILTAISPAIKQVTQSLFPDPADALKQSELEQKITMALIERSSDIEQAAAANIKMEAASKHWLAANWRPLMMVTFGGLIVARWFGYAAPNISPEEYLKLWDIVHMGIGGYTVGRSVEKVAPHIAKAMKKND